MSRGWDRILSKIASLRANFAPVYSLGEKKWLQIKRQFVTDDTRITVPDLNRLYKAFYDHVEDGCPSACYELTEEGDFIGRLFAYNPSDRLPETIGELRSTHHRQDEEGAVGVVDCEDRRHTMPVETKAGKLLSIEIVFNEAWKAVTGQSHPPARSCTRGRRRSHNPNHAFDRVRQDSRCAFH